MGLIYSEHFKTDPPSSLPSTKSRRTSSSASSASFNSLFSKSKNRKNSFLSQLSNEGPSLTSFFSPMNTSATFLDEDSALEEDEKDNDNIADESEKRLIGSDHDHDHTTGFLHDSVNNSNKVLRCLKCHTHLCLTSLIISDNFYGESGPALFVNKVINVSYGKIEVKKMKTGKYEIKSIFCNQCSSNVGWYYVYAEDHHQRYKEKKFVIENNLLEVVDY